jgi:hypothetical protein
MPAAGWTASAEGAGVTAICWRALAGISPGSVQVVEPVVTGRNIDLVTKNQANAKRKRGVPSWQVRNRTSAESLSIRHKGMLACY